MRVVNDRRSSTRVTVRGEALVHAPHGPVRCRCLDISPSGMSMVCPQAIKPKQRVRVESSFKGQRLVLEAVVVRRSRSREGHVLGVRFEGMSPAARDQLAEVLRSMQVQAALAMQACAIVDRLPVLQVPEPEPEPTTEKSPWSAPAAPMPTPHAAMPHAAMPPAAMPPAAMPPAAMPPAAMPPAAMPSAAMPSAAMPRPYAATPAPTVGPRQPSRPPYPTTLQMPWSAPASTEAPGRWDSTMITPPSELPRTPWSGGARPVGLEEGWTEEELVTTHYRPSSDDPQPLLVRAEPPPHEPTASLVDALELDVDVDVVEAPDAADCTEVAATVGSITVPEVPLPDWEVGAPVALAELVDTDAGSRSVPSLDEAAAPLELELDLDDVPPPPVLDRTMLTPQSPELASFAIEADDEWLEPVRTGKTMVVHVQDLVAAYAPLPVEPELDLPEAPAPATAPTTAPRLPDELQAALDQLRRREGSAAEPTEATNAGEPAPRPTKSARRQRRPGATEVYASPRRDDTQVRALYHAALATLGESERGDGS